MTVPHDDVPSIDLEPWFHGSASDRRAVASTVDSALRESGFLLVTGHGVPTELRASVRASAREFFAQPEPVKRRYAVPVGYRGWLPPGVEANGLAEGTITPPDLKETYSVGSEEKTGDAELDEFWFPDNVWPAESPALRAHAEEYLSRMRALADELLTVCAVALDKDEDFFTRETRHPSFTMNINRYPPLTDVGEPEPGQFRIGPHTDFGTVTILDREMGLGGLQVHTLDGRWVDAPYDPAAFTINIGDLLARWTGDRWRSTRHRVLPPDPRAPQEELVSLIFFYECSPKTWVSSLGPPVGVREYPPVLADAYLRGKLASISV
ncbi:isopenicillin N synthase family oxygenase [Allokutzneria sp. NRRL B-24872]|uniref:isopenicillin N synthase family dioxygenase n=1 Tax=Allokutzneria sp. NRRL B-24872 TaxID=1137961 RepID=UPI000A3B32C1|nr:2-oxoglutarate and iron-dependent oxygenase domain-containing protein [Allokutzneria sp. NRRL B-24872]